MNKSKLICLFAILMLVTIVETSSHLAFADSTTVTIRCGASITDRSCTTADSFNPQVVNINVGDTVTWTNADAVGHTVTSGSSSDSVTGTVFDSSLILAGGSFSFTFSQAGTYNYFDMVYPSMTGQVIASPLIPQTTESSQAQMPTIPSTTTPSTQYNIPYWVKNDAKWWSEGQISDVEFVKAIQYLVDNGILTPNQAMSEISQLQNQNQAIRQAASQTTNQINQLQQENYNLQTENENLKLQMQQDNDKLNEWNDYYNKVQTWAQNYNNTLQQALQNYDNAIQQALQVSQCTPLTSVKNGTITWNFCDSKGNQYTWSMPFTTYDANIKRPFPTDTIIIKEPDGTNVIFPNYAEFVEPSFSKVIDQVYDNAGSDDQFLYEVWFIVSQMTTYSQDITNSNLWPLQTFSDARGDCKDLSILVASMIRSSSHTQNWQVYLGIVDSNNPSNPQHYNHMMVSVHIGNEVQFIEATNKQNGLQYWNGIAFYGNWLPVGNTS